jgi:acetyltransferase
MRSSVYLERMFRPRSVAVVGAHNQPQRVGSVIMRNLLAGAFEGPIMPVNPRYEAVAGVLTYPDVASLPRTPDLAIICTPPETVPGIIDELGARGTQAAVVVARGLAESADATGVTLQRRMLDTARAYGMRLLGGGTLGIAVPQLGLNASFSRVKALPGNIAFVSQSDAVGTMILDWAAPRRVGFSNFVSLGDASDVGFAEVLDYLGSDPDTRAILLYIESLRERGSFMAAARGAARNKPVVAIKAGRRPPGGRHAAPISGDTLSLVEPDDVFDAALRRAGILRVHDVDELFSAVETLARARAMKGERLAIVANGGGAGVVASDELYAGGLPLAELSPATVERLRATLPPGASAANPIDLRMDAPGTRLAEVLRVLGESGEADAILVIHTPSTLASSTEAARVVVEAAARGGASLLTCWAGGDTVAPARKILVDAGVPTFDTPADAVRAFLFTVNYQRNREALIQTPPSVPSEFRPDPARARRAIQRVLDEGRDYLRAPERIEVLSAYGIPVVDTQIAETPEQAARIAQAIGFPVELALRSPDIRRKREVGGVALSLMSAGEVEGAARGMIAKLSRWRPDARITGFTVQPMVRRPHGRQLFVGAAVDPLFGPIILFGEGRATEGFRDFAVGLPPLNLPLARDLVSRTRAAALLDASPNRPAADRDALHLTLMKVSQLLVDLPEVVEMDVNPLLVDEDGVIAVGAFMKVAAAKKDVDRLAIRPYPEWLEERVELRDGSAVLLRPVRPEDEATHSEFVQRLSPEDSRFRFFHYVRSLPHTELARLTQIDYDREMAFIATRPGPDGRPETLGVIRAVSDPDNRSAEFSVVVRSDLKRLGLGTRMLEKMVAYCRARGTAELAGDVLAENTPMLELAKRFPGFTLSEPGEDGTVRVSRMLR